MTKNQKYYKILGIEEGATKEEIKVAYKKQARTWHPDKNLNNKEEAERKIKEINEAYEILENGTVEKYGCDYGEEIPNEKSAIGKLYLSGKLYEIHEKIRDFNINYGSLLRKATEKGEGEPIISDYHLIRAQKLLQIVNSYYYPIYKKIGWNEFKKEYISVFKENGLIWMSSYTTSGWEKAVGDFRKWIDFAREKIGLPKLTDKELGLVEGNNQNEDRQIPNNGKEKPKRIKDSVADIEKYNKSFKKENNETVRKFWELRDAIFNTEESLAKYSTVNSALYKKMNAKAIEAETGNFREIWTNDDENKIEEIKKSNESKLEKMKEAIKLMEKIIEEGKNSQPTTGNTQSGNKKRKADELEAHQSFTKKNRTVGNELSRLIREAQGLSKYEELAAKIEEIDKYQGEKAYNEEYQEEIKQLKTKLGNINKDKYRNDIVKKIDGKLGESDVKESDLDEETKQELTKIRNGEIEDVNKINEVENKISEKIGEKGAVNTLNKWLQRAKDLVNGVKNGTIDYLETELKKIRKGLYDFQYSTNTYQINAYQNKEKDVQAMLTKLENHSASNRADQPSHGFFQPKVLIPVGIVAVVLVAAALVIIRNRKQKKVKRF